VRYHLDSYDQESAMHAGAATSRTADAGLDIKPLFTRGSDPFRACRFETRQAKIVDKDKTVIFEMDNVEVPASWSQIATNIVVSKYLRFAPPVSGRAATSPPFRPQTRSKLS
jgi:ribonucleoside-diphosphate reductase alpha chain